MAGPTLPPNEVRPQPGPQTVFHKSTADIAIYGGAAGGGKSWALIHEGLRNIEKPGFAAVFFRRNLVQVKNPGGLWDESMKLYPLLGGKPSHNLEWTFPKGTRVKFGHLEHETTVMDWQGAQIPLLGFDELTHFDASQFWYMLSRNRSMCGVQPYVRATTNPDPDSWVAVFIAWWINQETGYPIPERSGVLRWFVRINDHLQWGDSQAEMLERYPDIPAKSATFIAAKLSDNVKLMQADPGYRANLLALSEVERERLLGGNWKIRQTGGLFKREWFELVDRVPDGTSRHCRAWDLAGTEKKVGNNPDWTAGIKTAAHTDGNFYVEDVSRAQESTGKVQERLKSTALIDGTPVRIRLPQDPGQAGKAQAEALVLLLAGYDVVIQTVSGDKETRARPASSLAEHGKIKLVRGHWNAAFLDELCGFPSTSSGANDDQVDAFADGINELALGVVHTSSVSNLRG
jgi:predicted phage terminase large subunit-like protein